MWKRKHGVELLNFKADMTLLLLYLLNIHTSPYYSKKISIKLPIYNKNKDYYKINN